MASVSDEKPDERTSDDRNEPQRITATGDSQTAPDVVGGDLPFARLPHQEAGLAVDLV